MEEKRRMTLIDRDTTVSDQHLWRCHDDSGSINIGILEVVRLVCSSSDIFSSYHMEVHSDQFTRPRP
jgi:hypothetical protein